MLNELLDFVDSDVRAGFRIHRLEVFNWGTFNRRIWTISPGGKNSLMTGDIGSGKSTLVDAITTLLVPPRRITYNKAAGAESGERSVRSYVLGYYKSERGEDRLSAKPVALRDHNAYSVLLAYFFNEGYDRGLTLAQVFWMRDGQSQPQRLYVVADGSLTIKDDFGGFGSDIAELRRRLRADRRVHLYDSFNRYMAHFRREFGIRNDQALDLFHQTVSMKSVGNLTDFVRTHMLEPFPVQERIQALIEHFDDLDRAHRAVLKAKAQIEALTPLVDDIDKFQEMTAIVAEMHMCRDALRPWFAARKSELLEKRLAELDDELARLEALIRDHEQTRRRLLEERDDLKRDIAQSGGDRMEQLQRAVDEWRARLERRQKRADEYNELARLLGLDDVTDADGFWANRRAAEQARENLQDRRVEVQNAVTEATVALRDLHKQHADVVAELQSLRSRRTNIPQHMVALRDQLCRAIGAREEELPFAGELIEVREEERAWEGAIERLLRSFGLSLLVPDRYYAQVTDWVERTDLRGRLVYYRARPRRDAAPPELHADSVVHKLSLRRDSEFRDWLERELQHRFDYACCDDLDQFRREPRAITRAGQIKDRGTRHEKDDRYAIGDRTRYILGWRNEAKIAALEQEENGLLRRIQAAERQRDQARAREERLRELELHYVRLEGFREFAELNWREAALEVQRLTQELEQLRKGSDRLRVLQEQLEKLEKRLAGTEAALETAREKRSVRRDRREEAQKQLESALQQAEQATPTQREEVYPLVAAMWSEGFADRTLTAENCDAMQSEMREWLQSCIDMYGKRMDRARDRIIDAMRSYKTQYPLDTQDVDVSIQAGDEYRRMLERLRTDDLPRFESEFQRLLRENTIREVANFQAQLHREKSVIVERIETINESLREIDFRPNRYIRLHADLTNNVEVRQFIHDLRKCTEGTLGAPAGHGASAVDEQYSEQKFLQVKAIIERFRGREGMTDVDRAWTRFVTDVRNWFVFSASEHWREDDLEYEHYTDSGGKSGGQKEKLAYTVLAASIAYQFGLKWGETRSRSFRFVVIDEAFGRGSDDSARYALRLFQKLNLQLLIVTPLQKIHVIEPFVSSVAFVHNEGDRESMVRHLTMEEYEAEKAAHRQADEASALARSVAAAADGRVGSRRGAAPSAPWTSDRQPFPVNGSTPDEGRHHDQAGDEAE